MHNLSKTSGKKKYFEAKELHKTNFKKIILSLKVLDVL